MLYLNFLLKKLIKYYHFKDNDKINNYDFWQSGRIRRISDEIADQHYKNDRVFELDPVPEGEVVNFERFATIMDNLETSLFENSHFSEKDWYKLSKAAVKDPELTLNTLTPLLLEHLDSISDACILCGIVFHEHLILATLLLKLHVYKDLDKGNGLRRDLTNWGSGNLDEDISNLIKWFNCFVEDDLNTFKSTFLKKLCETGIEIDTSKKPSFSDIPILEKVELIHSDNECIKLEIEPKTDRKRVYHDFSNYEINYEDRLVSYPRSKDGFEPVD